MKKHSIKPEDYPVKADGKEVKTTNGDSIATAKDEPIAEEVADGLNDQAYREEHDRWSA
jgi:hypothetical protein